MAFMTALQNGITENNKNQLFIYNKINHSLKKKKIVPGTYFCWNWVCFTCKERNSYNINYIIKNSKR